MDDLTDIKNRSSLVIGTQAGGILVLTLQGRDDESFLESVFDTLSKSLKKQLSGTRAAIFMVGFDGLDGAQLQSIASPDKDPSEASTGLRLATSKYLEKQNRDNLVGISFISSNSLMPVSNDLHESSGTAYYSQKNKVPFGIPISVAFFHCKNCAWPALSDLALEKRIPC